jgi:hypothetical protein
MAITTKSATEETKVVTVNIELVKYARYVRQDILYEKGVPYKFTAAQAEILLEETDDVSGMPIWKRWKPASQRMVVQREVQPTDMTAAPVVAADMSEDTTKRIDIGSDDELAGMLPTDDDGAVNV